MIFNKHTSLTGQHAYLSASKPSWLNYDDEKFERMWGLSREAARGTILHAFAAEAIKLKQRLPKVKSTLNMYVNDCINWDMTPELVLFYSRNCFGTTDAISYRALKLRISDLKNGKSLTSKVQLEVYAALFCLEYHINPFEITIELRIYQNDEVRLYIGDPDRIIHIMDEIKRRDRMIEEMRWEGEV
jgi:hypothetical protein